MIHPTRDLSQPRDFLRDLSGLARRCLLGLALLAIWPAPVGALDPSQSIFQYNCRTWRRDNGLPANVINSIAVTTDGRLWLATSRGIVHFDGLEFNVVEPPEASHVAGKIVLALAPAADGGLWFGMQSAGVGYFDGKQTFAVPLEDEELRMLSVRAVIGTEEGSFLGSTRGFDFVHRAGPGRNIAQGPYLDVFSLLKGPEGQVWIGTAADGLLSWDGSKIERFPDPTLREGILAALAQTPDGTLWIGTPEGLRAYDRALQRIDLARDFGEIKALLVDRGGALWIGTYGKGLFRYYDGVLQQMQVVDGLSSNQVVSLAEGSDGSLWVGTDNGLTQLSPFRFPTYSDSEGLPHAGALAVAPDRQDGVWVGTPDGVARFRAGRFETFGGTGSSVRLGSNWVKYIYPASNGDLYFIGAQKNLDRFVDGEMRQSWTFEAWPRRLAEDDEGLILVVAGTLRRQSGDEWVPYLLGDGSPVNLRWITDILVDGESIWIGAAGGLFELRDGRLFDHCSLNGLPAMRCSELARDDEGGIWGAGRDGLIRCKDGQIRVLTSADGLPDDFINAIVNDTLGSFWMDFNRGIFRVSQQSLIAVAEGRASTLKFDLFEGSDAIATAEKIAFEHSGCRSTDGRVWFPCARGLIEIDPANVSPPAPPPPVTIMKVWINGEPRDPAAPIAAEAGPGALQVDYSALNYLAPRNTRYRYRLLGYDSKWVEAGARRSAFYTNLLAGDYVFEVQAAGVKGLWSEVPARFAFALPRRFVETWTFRLGLGALLLGFAWWIFWNWNLRRQQRFLRLAHVEMEDNVRARTAELARANDALRLEVEERKRAQKEAESLHEEMRVVARRAQQATQAKSQFLANMSHEIRTPMNAVIGMTNLLLESPLQHHQREYAEITRDSAEALLTILNDILDLSKVEAGKLELEKVDFDLGEIVEGVLTALAVRAAEKKLELACFLAADLPTRWTGDPVRLRQVLINLVGNAIKFTERGAVTVRVARAPEAELDAGMTSLRLEVSDTGVGIAEEARAHLFRAFSQLDSSTTRRFGGTGLGLAISREIVELMGGRIEVESTPGEGSVFAITVPLQPVPEDPAAADPAAPLRGRRVLALCRAEVGAELLRHYAEAWGLTLELRHREGLVGPRLAEADAAGEAFDFLLVDHEERATYVPLQLHPYGAGGKDLPTVHLVPLVGANSNIGTPELRVKKPVSRRALLEACLQAVQRPAVAAPAAPAENSAMESSEASLDAADRIARLRVLVAEDNQVNQRVIQLQLAKLGCAPDFAKNGVEALAKLDARDYDLVLMDCQMPEVDGYEATRRLRRTARNAGVFVVALTANTMEGDREKCLAASMDDYLSKPVRMPELKLVIERCLERLAVEG